MYAGLRIGSICLLLAALAGAAAAAPRQVTMPDPRAEGLAGGERLEALVERVRLEQQSLRTLEAGFTQHKESAMLLEPVESRGVFSYAAPDRVRWEYEAPNPISLVIEGEQMTTWYRDIDQAERIQIGRHSQRVLQLLGAGSSMDKLLEYFTVTLSLPADPRSPYELTLAPRFSRVAKRLRGMSVWIDAERFLPVRLRYEEPDGDLTEYRFFDLRVNGELPPERFELVLPASVDVKVVDLDRRAGLR